MVATRTESAPEILRRLLNHSGLTIEALALACGYKHASGLQRYLDPTAFKKQRFNVELATKLAAALTGTGNPPLVEAEVFEELAGVPAPPEMDRGEQPEEPPPNAVEAPADRVLAIAPMPLDVPLHGVAVGGNGGDFRFNGQMEGYVRRPPGIAKRRSVFAIYAQGESMAPWRQPGDLVYVDPTRPPRKGDYVVVECYGKDGQAGDAYLKKLVRMDGNVVVLEQYNPPDNNIRIPRSRVKNVYRVIDWPELLGV